MQVCNLNLQLKVLFLHKTENDYFLLHEYANPVAYMTNWPSILPTESVRQRKQRCSHILQLRRTISNVIKEQFQMGRMK